MTTPKISSKTFSYLLLNNKALSATQAKKIRSYINADGNEEERSERYHEYLWSPHWRGLLERVTRLLDNHCESCSTGPVTYLHPLTYTRLGEERLTDVLGVCRDCRNALQSHGLKQSEIKRRAWIQRQDALKAWKPGSKGVESSPSPPVDWSLVYHPVRRKDKPKKEAQSKRDRLAYVKGIVASGERPKGMPRTEWDELLDESQSSPKKRVTQAAKPKPQQESVVERRNRFLARNPNLKSPEV